ncbi:MULTISPECIES: oxygen-insensitive NADPH nitroreductase [Marinobacter]|uniref:oxygen-insensitive NADPH nitroreductase n=1 Tax=Marinobacter TaxID=2742 RepID=UPI0012444B62|nr:MULTISPECIES: oxygen-insensitive NADPH nitroreductase [Marinobacter]MBL3556056.1 oxygen-insensitive NADPH nitroreductase [Marinobacter sp. JB05H06]
MNPTIELLKSHRSIRKFQDWKIRDELFEELIRAGQSAATSSHVQAYSIIHVANKKNRKALAELSGGQRYVAECSHFLVFCADMKRPTDAAERTGTEVVRGTTEQLLVASIDTTLVAQNVATAAEAEGLGVCYIGGIRNDPAEVSKLLRLPDHVYPVFGMCIGYPDQKPEIKPRLPMAAILKQDYYEDEQDVALVAEYDNTMHAYYQARTAGKKDTTWSKQLTQLFSTKLRPHMRDFLRDRGFEMK